MKRFKDLEVGDKVFKVFFKLRPIKGLGNVFRVAKIIKINPDPDDQYTLNIFTKKHSFDVDESDFNHYCIILDNCDTIEINSTSVLLGVFQFVFRLVPCYILFLLNKVR